MDMHSDLAGRSSFKNDSITDIVPESHEHPAYLFSAVPNSALAWPQDSRTDGKQNDRHQAENGQRRRYRIRCRPWPHLNRLNGPFCGMKLAIFCMNSGMMASGQKHPPSMQVGVTIMELIMAAFCPFRINPATVLATPNDTSIKAIRIRKCNNGTP